MIKSRTKKLFFFTVAAFCFGFFSKNVQAATYYVRVDGGTDIQCNGLSDAAYPGSGTGQSCAFNHLFWLLKPNGLGGLSGMAILGGGDTVIIGPGSYMMGVGAPNSSACSSAWAYGCSLPPIPSGKDSSHPTRILGKNWENRETPAPEIWGYGRLEKIISLQGSNNVEIRYLDITDHSACIFNSPDPEKRCDYGSPYDKPIAKIGIFAADSSNVHLSDLNIHGLSSKGILAGRLKDWTLERLTIRGNGSAGFDGDIGHGAIGSGTDSSNSGFIRFKDSKIQYSGCGEKYPDNEIYGCFSQDQGGYGDGLGTYYTGGDWTFENVEFLHNVSDGLDLLYHNGEGSVTIKSSRFEGNAGNQAKVSADILIENSIFISNCDYFFNNPIAEQGGDPDYYTQAGFNHCRATGTAIVTSGWKPGRWAVLTNSLVTGTSSILIEASGSTCDGTEKFISRNNIFLGMEVWYKKTHGEPGIKPDMFYLDGSDGNGAGHCGLNYPETKINFDNRNSIAYNLKYEQCPNGNNVLCENPLLADVPPLFDAENIHTYGEKWDVKIQSSSPARDKGVSPAGELVFGTISIPNIDTTGASRPLGGRIDWGAYEYIGEGDSIPPASPTGLSVK